MGLSLIALTLSWSLLGLILKVAFGLGMVIFVHELGHFLVAKACGVKCEKFYIGFDIYGLKLAKLQWGETEYGIGILPLGGYVKMLGQDDNPARAAEERERSKLQAPSTDPRVAAATSDEQLDPRSYMAKSVPQRMAIISAGVIMNLIFAVLMAALAYGLGVKQLACGISAVSPGDAAWRAGLEPGDKIVGIAGFEGRELNFSSLMYAVILCDMDKGVDFKIQREGFSEPFWVNVKPDNVARKNRPTIGVVNAVTTTLANEEPAYPYSAAAKTGKFKPGDKIVEVDGVPVKTKDDLEAQFLKHLNKAVQVTVERKGTPPAPDQPAPVETLQIELPPQPVRSFGLVMKMGKITAVQKDSPAEKADLRAGDSIIAIDDQPPGDPLRLPEVLRERAGETIKLTISREVSSGQDETLEKQVTLRDVGWWERPIEVGSPISAPSLGVAYKVLNIVHSIDKNSPAAQAQLTKEGKPADVPLLAAGDEISKIAVQLPKSDKDEDKDKKAPTAPEELEFSAEQPNWPLLHTLLQQLPEGAKFTFTLKDGRQATLGSTDVEDWFYPSRGLIESPEFVTIRAHSFGQALSMGLQETKDQVLQVYLFLRKIGTQVSVKGLGGPVTIARAAGEEASKGFSSLLLFLTLLSANLAVLNFLPIPLLDGGHMVFLALEGILRRPVNERVVVAFHYLGFVFIISLMLFVLGLDLNIIPR